MKAHYARHSCELTRCVKLRAAANVSLSDLIIYGRLVLQRWRDCPPSEASADRGSGMFVPAILSPWWAMLSM